jgi:hypothetical protein
MAVTREGVVVFLMLLATAQMLVENPAVPPWLRPNLPTFVHAGVSYTRLQQGWRMFAPEAPTSESSIMVDAVTRDGRHVDPINEAAVGRSDPTSRELPIAPGYNVFWVDYLVRIKNTGSHHGALREWILAFPRRTGNPNDAIASFEVISLERRTPKPGEAAPPTSHRVIFSYP